VKGGVSVVIYPADVTHPDTLACHATPKYVRHDSRDFGLVAHCHGNSLRGLPKG
jgi:hypothetical protein